ncbi:MAG TPA: C40 family peptidase [Gaiellales bacterium]
MKRSAAIILGAACLLPAPPALAAGAGVAHGAGPATPLRITVGEAAVRFAKRFRGTPYVWAGTTPRGFDCSGFTRFVYAHFGFRLPHSSYAQWSLGRHVARRADLRPGDLVFFGLGHVGIWVGAGRFIHAPHTGDVVSVQRLASGWYASSYSGAVRLSGTQRPLRPAHRGRRRGPTDVLSFAR